MLSFQDRFTICCAQLFTKHCDKMYDSIHGSIYFFSLPYSTLTSTESTFLSEVMLFFYNVRIVTFTIDSVSLNECTQGKINMVSERKKFLHFSQSRLKSHSGVENYICLKFKAFCTFFCGCQKEI